MRRPPAAWIDDLPASRLLIEFSLWSADLNRLADEIRRIETHADLLHIDVADGHFAPAFLFFPDLLARVREQTALPIHVHLMVTGDILLEQIRQFRAAGADVISVHVENARSAAALDLIEGLGALPGLVLQLETPVDSVARHLHRIRLVTLLGTPIGVKGCGLDARAAGRLRAARTCIAAANLGRRVLLAADGGIREHTVPLLRAAGADSVVAGSLVFGAPDLAARVREMRELPGPDMGG